MMAFQMFVVFSGCFCLVHSFSVQSKKEFFWEDCNSVVEYHDGKFRLSNHSSGGQLYWQCVKDEANDPPWHMVM